MRILVTGATGYIGSNIVQYMSNRLDKYEVFALVRSTSNLDVFKTIRNRIDIIEATSSFESIKAAIDQAKPDVVIHLVALSLVSHKHSQIEELINSNIIFGTLLLEAMVQNGVSCMVNTSTFWEHMDGSQEYRPVNLYAATKRAFEDILRYYENAYKIRAVTLKLYGTYGPKDPRMKIFDLFKKSMTVKEPVNLTPGYQKLDLVYIEDVVAAYEKAVQYVYRKKEFTSETFFIGSGVDLEMREIARIYEECVRKPLNLKWEGRPYRSREVMAGYADIKDARIKLGWAPRFNLKEGIAKMLKTEETI